MKIEKRDWRYLWNRLLMGLVSGFFLYGGVMSPAPARGVAEPAADPVVSDADLEAHNYPYIITRNYWMARARAMAEGKILFVLSGAAWCSYCSMVKDYLCNVPNFGKDFIVYYASRESSSVYPYFHGGLPQYGTFDPRKINPWAGIGEAKTWANAWVNADNGAFLTHRGYSTQQIDAVIAAARAAWSSVDMGDWEHPSLTVEGAAAAVANEPTRYTLKASFPDGVSMTVDHRVAWEVVSGEGTMTADGSLTPTGVAPITIRATTFTDFPGATAERTIQVIDSSEIVGLELPSEAIDLEQTPAPAIRCVARLKDGSSCEVTPQSLTVSLVKGSEQSPEGFTGSYMEFQPRLEDGILRYVGTKYPYAKQYYLCDHRITLKATYGAFSTEKEIQVYAPMRVRPLDPELLSSATVAPGSVIRIRVPRVACAQKGLATETDDVKLADYFLQLSSLATGYDTDLRLAVPVVAKPQEETLALRVFARKSGGASTGWTEAAQPLSIRCLAPGEPVRQGAYANVSIGWLKAYFPAQQGNEALALADSDGDGFANWEEFLLGTEPNDAADAFAYTMQHFDAKVQNDVKNLYYKVMFAARPDRVYTIKAKKAWTDAWQTVGSFTYETRLSPSIVNADLADNASFFQVSVGFSAESGGQTYSDTVFTPNGLAIAPEAHVDLSSVTDLPLRWQTFAVDDYAPGTIWITPPATAKAGDTLLAVPAGNARHVEGMACFQLKAGTAQESTCTLTVRTSADGSSLELVLAARDAIAIPHPAGEDLPELEIELAWLERQLPWLEKHAGLTQGTLTDRTALYTAFANTRTANGHLLWEAYVIGLENLEDSAENFCLFLKLDAENRPILSWSPDLSAERAFPRIYTLYGKTALTDVWEPADVTRHRFFKVTVEMNSTQTASPAN